jgi:polyhydroxybutyrate depolymerase
MSRFGRRAMALVFLSALALGAAACGGANAAGSARANAAGGQPAASQPAASQPAASQPAMCTPAKATPGTDPAQSLTFAYKNTTRAYLLALPTGYDGVTRYPLIINFSGFKASKENQETNTSMGSIASARGFIVVTPDALGNPKRWNTPGDPAKADDFGFVHALVGDLSNRLCVDSGRVYAAGHSNGSQFAARLVCQAPYIFSAVALVSGTTPSECPSGVTPSVLSIHGTADKSVPYNGGMVGPDRFPNVPSVITYDTGRYRCRPDGVTDSPALGVGRARYTGCAGGAEIDFDTVVGGTHPWPGGPVAVADKTDSLGGKTFHATEAIVDFFAARKATVEVPGR